MFKFNHRLLMNEIEKNKEDFKSRLNNTGLVNFNGAQ